MSRCGPDKTTVASLVGASVRDSGGAIIGRVREFAVSPSRDASRVYGLVLKLSGRARGDKENMVAVEDLEDTSDGLRLTQNSSRLLLPNDPALILLERDLLDQQIIDVHGRKVVRVNDVHLCWEHTSNHRLNLRIAEVEVGLRGAVRRLIKGLPFGTVEAIASRFTPSVIPWEFVDLIDPS